MSNVTTLRKLAIVGGSIGSAMLPAAAWATGTDPTTPSVLNTRER